MSEGMTEREEFDSVLVMLRQILDTDPKHYLEIHKRYIGMMLDEIEEARREKVMQELSDLGQEMSSEAIVRQSRDEWDKS